MDPVSPLTMRRVLDTQPAAERPGAAAARSAERPPRPARPSLAGWWLLLGASATVLLVTALG